MPRTLSQALRFCQPISFMQFVVVSLRWLCYGLGLVATFSNPVIRTVARSFQSPLIADPRSIWYSQQEIADLLHIRYQSARQRLMRLRRAGLGPSADQCKTLRIHAARRFRLIRGDYVAFMVSSRLTP